MSDHTPSDGIDPTPPRGNGCSPRTAQVVVAAASGPGQSDIARTCNNRGVACLMAGDLAGAIAALDEAVRLDPRFAEGYSNRGAVHYAQGNYARAVADFTAALGINPGHAVLHNNRGSARLAAWDFAGAVADFDAALAIDPKYCLAYLSRGLARYHLRDPGAEADYRVAFRLDPGFAARHLVGLLVRSLQQYPRAGLADCGHHLRHNPDDFHSLARRGLLMLLQGREPEARPDFDRYRHLNPDGAFKLDHLIDEARRHRASTGDSRPPTGK